MTIRVFALACLAALAVLGVALAAAPLRVLETMPANGAVLSGIISEYYVRFDRPIDHLRSFFLIKQDDKVIERLALRYKTQPDTLYAQAPTLQPGRYTLSWFLMAIDGNEVQQGEVDFSVSAR
jgi:methionine-rich copper-binding protein CopC